MSPESQQLNDMSILIKPNQECFTFNVAFHTILIITTQSMRLVFLRYSDILLQIL